MELTKFRHKGLKRLYEQDDASGVPSASTKRLRNILAALEFAAELEQLKTLPGWKLHPLKGARRGTYAMRMKNPPHPGVFIQDEILEPLSLTITKAAEVLGVRRATLSELVNAKAALSGEMALRLEKAFGVSMDLLLRMQAGYDAAEARAHSGEINVKRFRIRAG